MAEEFEKVRIGKTEGRFYPGSHRAVIWVGGVGGGWDTPAHQLYPRLAEDFSKEKIASLRIRYRHPTWLEESIEDVQAGIQYLADHQFQEIGLVGYSMGGAVVIRAGINQSLVQAVVTLAAQSYGAENVAELPAHCALLLLHGEEDSVLPPGSSEYLFSRAHEPKHLILYPGAGHNLDEASEGVTEAVRSWLLKYLGVDSGREIP